MSDQAPAEAQVGSDEWTPQMDDSGFYRQAASTGGGEGAKGEIISSQPPHPSVEWRSMLEKSIKKNRSEVTSKYCQLATIREDGTPANRTIVFRGWVPETQDIYFVTDSRSEKPDQIKKNPATELAWYLTISREQYRLGGTLTVTGSEAGEDTPLGRLRVQAWGHMSESAKAGFHWPAPGSSPVADVSVFEAAKANIHVIPDHFTILSLTISRIDYLCLKGVPQTRKFFTLNKEGGWDCRPANP